MTVKLGGEILRSKMFPSRPETRVINYSMITESRPPWMRQLGFLDLLKVKKSTEIELKVIKNSEGHLHELKTSKVR